jgi:uncharacterized protein
MSSSPPAAPNGNAGTAPAGAQVVPSQQQLIRQASQDFADYEQLTAQGKLTEAGQKLDDLKRVLGKLNGQ